MGADNSIAPSHGDTSGRHVMSHPRHRGALMHTLLSFWRIYKMTAGIPSLLGIPLKSNKESLWATKRHSSRFSTGKCLTAYLCSPPVENPIS